MSNLEIGRHNLAVANLAFTLETFKWLSHGEFPVDTSRPKPKDNALLIDRHGISVWRVVFCGVLPGLMAASGATILIRRRRR
jgi:ABC-2 type transport system permease protein